MIKRTRISDDFEVTARIVQLAHENDWPDPYGEIDAFKDYHMAKGSLMVDWEAAFRTWLRNSKRFGDQRNAQRDRDPEPAGYAGIRAILKRHS